MLVLIAIMDIYMHTKLKLVKMPTNVTQGV